jgi:hypothetical protein
MTKAFDELKPVFDQLLNHTEVVFKILDKRLSIVEKQLIDLFEPKNAERLKNDAEEVISFLNKMGEKNDK